ncbi:MAG: hypothetical protein ACYCO3_16505 [Mycobacteriales bacterium]
MDAYAQEVALAWFEQPANLARLTATDGDDWLKQARAAEEELAGLQRRLDEAADHYAAGGAAAGRAAQDYQRSVRRAHPTDREPGAERLRARTTPHHARV